MAKLAPVRRRLDDNRIFIDMPDAPDNPCTACGACCTHFRVSFYCGELTGGSGGFVPAEMTSKLSPLMACMKGTEAGHGRCIALAGEPGRPGVRCRIYARRPTPCREFANWLADGTPNPDCQRLRTGLGLPPLAPLPGSKVQEAAASRLDEFSQQPADGTLLVARVEQPGPLGAGGPQVGQQAAAAALVPAQAA